ncbi:MAG: PUA domain-containing protein, partial [Bdellovibrionales bacterium]
VAFDASFHSIKTINKTKMGKGGMATKLEAVRKCTPLGIPVSIGSFSEKQVLQKLIHGQTGTYFEANLKYKRNKQTRILSRKKTNTWVNVDKGAAQAILENRSLLPVGISKVNGKFNRGDVVSIKNANTTIAMGIVEYSSKELKLFLDNNKTQKPTISLPSKVFIHKDNLVYEDNK